MIGNDGCKKKVDDTGNVLTGATHRVVVAYRTPVRYAIIWRTDLSAEKLPNGRLVRGEQLILCKPS